MSLSLTSPAFSPDAPIPATFTCDDRGISPPLEWSGVPDGTESLALIVDDPDAPDPAAPQRTFVHWVLYDLTPSSHGLPEGVPSSDLPDGAAEGLNDRSQKGYTGPCPPIGRHRYVHKLYALDTKLNALSSPSKAELQKAMEGHVLERSELIGTYERKG